MTRFKVIDVTTSREVSADKISEIAKEKRTNGSGYQQFYIGEDGQLVLADDCGNIAFCDMEKLGLMPVFEGKYPDLEYFEALMLANLRRLCPEMFSNSQYRPSVELVDMYPQIWPDTACGFSEPGMAAEREFTTEITTVMKVYDPDSKETYFGVFFGNKPAYIVDDDTTDMFFSDLRYRKLKSKHHAERAY